MCLDPHQVCLEDYPIHTVTGLVKQWLRELPDPLMTFTRYNDFLHAVGEKHISHQGPAFGNRNCGLFVLSLLPNSNRVFVFIINYGFLFVMCFLPLIELPEKQEQLHAIYKVLEELPTANFNTLERLVFHLVR